MKTTKPASALDKLDALLLENIKPVPKDWFTIDQMVERFGGSERHAYRELERHIRAGRIEHQHWTKIGLMGKRVRFRIFRVK